MTDLLSNFEDFMLVLLSAQTTIWKLSPLQIHIDDPQQFVANIAFRLFYLIFLFRVHEVNYLNIPLLEGQLVGFLHSLLLLDLHLFHQLEHC